MKLQLHAKRILQLLVVEHPFVAIALIVLCCLVPFANQAIQTDDALFVWAGQWILKHPIDFYGGTVNWYGSATAMWHENLNPPLMSYLLAGTAFFLGWHAIALHLTGMVIALAATAGIYSLAKMWCGRPFLATLMALFTPAFLVSSTTLMCDVLMLTFWVWALAGWEQALNDKAARWKFVLTGFLAGLAVLAKYTAILLLPLLVLLSLLRPGRWRWRIIGLLVPVAMVGSYECLTAKLYGTGLFSDAVRHAGSFHFEFPGGWTAKAMIGLAFAGGSLLPVLFFAPWLWRCRTWLAGGAGIFAAIVGIFWLGYNPGLIHSWTNQGIWTDWVFRLQVVCFLLAGLQLALLAAMEFWERRDVISLFLLVWVFGMLIFAGVLNWTVNARSFLPAVPAAAILVARRLERREKGGTRSPGWSWAPMLPAMAVTFIVVVANYRSANLVRTVARQFASRYQSPGHPLWFNGHGGFQYYLQKFGARPIDSQRSVLGPGDTVAVSWSSGGFVTLPEGSVGLISMLAPDTHSWVTLSGGNKHGLAGFYDADWGPIPFTIGGSTPGYLIAKAYDTIRLPLAPPDARDASRAGLWGNPPVSQTNSAASTSAKHQIALAEQFERKGNTENALQTYRQALQADPDNIEALDHLARLLAVAGNPANPGTSSEAVQLAMKAAKLSKWRQPMVIETLATAFAADNEFSNAVTMAQAANELATLTGRPDIAARAAKSRSAWSGR